MEQRGRGPFGEKGFRLGLAGCCVLVVVSPVLLAVGGKTVRSVATSLLVVGVAPPLSAREAVPAGAGDGRSAELDEPGEEADPYTLGRDEGRGTEHAPRFRRDSEEGAGRERPSRTTPTTGGDR